MLAMIYYVQMKGMEYMKCKHEWKWFNKNRLEKSCIKCGKRCKVGVMYADITANITNPITAPITLETTDRQEFESSLVAPRLYSTESVKGRKI